MAEIQLNYTGEQINAKLAQIETQQESINTLQSRNKFYNNITVPTTSWSANATYPKYPYRASIVLNDITPQYYPEVIFNITEATSGLFSPICETYNGGVYLYAGGIPSTSITIPTIKCTYSGV